MLAGYLAGVAGFVNSWGFVRLGLFTSHVTGNVSRFADQVVAGHAEAAAALAMIASFFGGAFVSSMALESNVARRRPRIYAALLATEAGLLAAAMAAGTVHAMPEGVLLCWAMGMQNSFVTRLSGAIVRTTHLTGVVTDLGIEAARWFRFWRSEVARRTGLRVVVGAAMAEPPPHDRAVLLLTILCAFAVGSIGGAYGGICFGEAALALPIALLLCGALVAFVTRAQLPPRDQTAS
ncbi:MAG TPA: YoaK family protein [Kofleriaceae bacterium]